MTPALSPGKGETGQPEHEEEHGRDPRHVYGEPDADEDDGQE
jgi:hypothetical protein